MTGLELLFTPENAVTFLTLTFLEIVLAGDNLVLIAILSSKLPEHQRPLARRLGLFAAVGTRILLLFSLFWLSHLQTPISLGGSGGLTITPHQIVFGIGGTFLLLKAVSELVQIFFGSDGAGPNVKTVHHAFSWVILQIAFFDIVFSLDSVIAAIGIAKHIEIMVAAVLVAAFVMLFLVNPISEFIERHRIVKVAALDLLVVIGAFLLAEAFHYELPRGELYLGFFIVLIVQSILLLVRGLPEGVRYALVIASAVALIGGAALLINDPVMAENLRQQVLGIWQDGTKALGDAVDSVQRMIPKG